MLRLLTDENFNRRILRGLIRRTPNIDPLSVKDAGLSGKSDHFLLRWAFQDDRTILTHDKKTMTKYAAQLVARGEFIAGVIFVPNTVAIARAIDDLELVVACYSQSEMRNRIEYLPY
jgi:hypothetical protein